LIDNGYFPDLILWKQLPKAKSFVYSLAFFLKTPSPHQYLMTLKAQKAVYTILVFSVLYARFLYAKTFVCDCIMIQGS